MHLYFGMKLLIMHGRQMRKSHVCAVHILVPLTHTTFYSYYAAGLHLNFVVKEKSSTSAAIKKAIALSKRVQKMSKSARKLIGKPFS